LPLLSPARGMYDIKIGWILLGIIVCVQRRGGNAIPSGRTANHKTNKPEAKIAFKERFILTKKRDSVIVM